MTPKSALKQRTPQHLGVGIYSVAEAAHLLKVSASTVQRWLDPASGLVTRAFSDEADVLSFLELMELHFIQIFRQQGVSLATIRTASRKAAQRFGADYPFAVKRFDTDGKSIFATLIDERPGRVVVEDLKHGQLVFEQVMRPFFRKLDYQDQHEIIRYWPLERQGRVVLDPAREFGKPIDAETGVPTETISDALRAGGGQDARKVADWLGIPLAAVQAAMNFEQSLSA